MSDVEYKKRVEDRIRTFDFKTTRPTSDANGQQLAPQIFQQWIAPCVWADTENNAHMDVPMLLQMFELPDTPADRKYVTEKALKLLDILEEESGRVVVQ